MIVAAVVDGAAVGGVVVVAVCAWAGGPKSTVPASSTVPANRNAPAKSTVARTRRVREAALITGSVHSIPAVCARCARGRPVGLGTMFKLMKRWWRYTTARLTGQFE